MEKQQLELLCGPVKEQVGKKLVWWSYDSEQDRMYLFFEGLSAIAVEGVVGIADGPELARKILGEKLGDALHTLQLKDIMGSSGVAPAAAPAALSYDEEPSYAVQSAGVEVYGGEGSLVVSVEDDVSVSVERDAGELDGE